MPEVFQLVNPQIASCNLHLHRNLSCRAEQYLLQISGISVSIPYIPAIHNV